MDGGSGDDTVRLKRAEVARLIGNGGDGSGFPGSSSAATSQRARRGSTGWIMAVLLVALAGAGLGAVLLFWPEPTPEAPASTVSSEQQAPAPPVAALAPVPAPPAAALAPVQAPPAAALAPVQAPPAAAPAPPVATLAPAPSTPLTDGAPAPVPPPAPEAEPPPAVGAAPPPLASEFELVAALPTEPSVFRLRDNPRIFVLLFPSLDAQGDALNRIAALIEKAGLPRDRLLDDAELAEAVRRHGDSAATWYLGHDYNGTDIARFFALADRDDITLNPVELWVRDRFREARALVPEGTEIALISTANPDHRMDPRMRAAILRHEIGHGHFFTLPEFREHVLRVWRERFRERDRQAFRTFLAREGYDTTNELLMANEAMAYLIYTPDARFFTARQVGMSEAEVNKLREAMRARAP